jgi:5'-methylthioadenosine phosphorylase
MLAVIGGLGFLLEGQDDKIETPYGEIPIALTKVKGHNVVFISRHGAGHLPPHRVNYRALISAARKCGATRVISTNTVGTMSYHPVGSLFVPSDFVEFTRSRACTFFEDRAVHVDMSQPYCPVLSSRLADAARSLDLPFSEGTYVCSEGPHLESPAQIRMMRQFGDVVGMTGYPEVVLAREAGLCYASLCIVTNPACGMTGGKGLCISEITGLMERCHDALREIIGLVAQRTPEERACSCRTALFDARL